MSVRSRLRFAELRWLVAGVVAVALLARLTLLGSRIAHWDEARVGYWILRYMETGVYAYRPIVHGPFLQQVTPAVFTLLGASDFSMRLVPALVGGLLPASALLFRDRLSDRETLALSLLLAADPTLLYFSRFMRGDVLVGAFAFVAFGLFVRAVDRTPRYLVPAMAMVALAFTVKENALAYLAAWVAALGLLLDHRLLLASASDADGSVPDALARALGRVRAGVRAGLPWLLVSLPVFLGITVAFYAPRDPAPGAVSLQNAGTNATAWSLVVEEATLGSADRLVEGWVAGEGEHSYFVFLGGVLKDFALGSAGVAVLGLLGTAVDRYGGAPRSLVQHAFFWGLVSVAAYPAITDIVAPWLVVHLVLPLSIPAAVGAVWLLDVGREALATDDRRRATVVGVVLLLVSVQLVGGAVATSYVAPTAPENELAQYAQPVGDFRPTLETMAASDDPALLVYGSYFVTGREVGRLDYRPHCMRVGGWFNALPLPWYLERDGVGTTCAANASDLPDELPPVVAVKVENRTLDAVRVPDALAARTEGYDRRLVLFRQRNTPVLFLVDDSRVDRKDDSRVDRKDDSRVDRKDDSRVDRKLLFSRAGSGR
ncbi:flippase activity-associated protein Agl23 [Natronomonas sp. EA1]|uniref:flippase activity-associated protein Agl23 n=1 Tax=Natronomonas sp. EA1 TaxID=3421655 RepID=UPI003EBC3787